MRARTSREVVQEPVCGQVILESQRSEVAPLLVSSQMIGNDDASNATTVQAMDKSASNETGRSGHQIPSFRTEDSPAAVARSLSTSPKRSFRSFHHKRNVF